MIEEPGIKETKEFDGVRSDNYNHAKVVVFDENTRLEEETAGDAVFHDRHEWPRHCDITLKPSTHEAIVQWSEDDEEVQITPKFVYGGSDALVPSVLWQVHEPGQMICFEAGSPGVGHTTYKVTRKDDTGLWGICTEDTVWVPEDPRYFE